MSDFATRPTHGAIYSPSSSVKAGPAEKPKSTIISTLRGWFGCAPFKPGTVAPLPAPGKSAPTSPSTGRTAIPLPSIKSTPPATLREASDRIDSQLGALRASSHGPTSAVGKAIEQIQISLKMMSSGPVAFESIEDHVKELDTLRSAVAVNIKELDIHGTDAAASMACSLATDMHQQLSDRIEYLKKSVATDACSYRNLYKAKADMTKAGAMACADLRHKLEASLEAIPKPDAKQHTAIRLAILQYTRLEGRLMNRAAKLTNKSNTTEGHCKNPDSILGPKKAKISADVLARRADQLKAGNLDTDTPDITDEALIDYVLEQTVRGAGVSKKTMSSSTVEHAFEHAFNRLHNTQPWDVIDKTVVIRSGNVNTSYTSKSMPASKMDVFAKAYEAHKLQGVNCHDSLEHRHAANLWTSTLKEKSGKELFSCVRHGVNAAFGLSPKGIKQLENKELGKIAREALPDHAKFKNKTDVEIGRMVRSHWTLIGPNLLEQVRHAASMARSREVVQACALAPNQLEKIQEALKAGQALPPLRISSVSLLTPDIFRRGKNDNERQMYVDQTRAWAEISANEQTIQIPNPAWTEESGNDVKPYLKVKVKVEVAAFDLPVNAGGVGAFSPVASGRFKIQAGNDAAFKKLLGDPLKMVSDSGHCDKTPGGWTGEALQALDSQISELTLKQDVSGKTDKDPKSLERNKQIVELQMKRDQIQILSQQVADLHLTGAQFTAGEEPYKLVSRVMVLSDLVASVAVNCKSGKDRTGEADVEAKLLATQLHLNRDEVRTQTAEAQPDTQIRAGVPRPNRKRGAEESQQLHAMMMGSGAQEIQQVNTSLMGFKLKGVDALDRQIGASSKHDPLAKDRVGTSERTAT